MLIGKTNKKFILKDVYLVLVRASVLLFALWTLANKTTIWFLYNKKDFSFNITILKIKKPSAYVLNEWWS